MDRRSLIKFLRDNAIQFNDNALHSKLTNFVKSGIEISDEVDLPSIILSFIFQAKDRWKKCSRTIDAFDKLNENWLDGILFVQRNKVGVRHGGRPSVS